MSRRHDFRLQVLRKHILWKARAVFRMAVMSFVLVFCLRGLLQAQSTVKIRGRVSDKETGELLRGANVIVQGTGYGAMTDEYGLYEIENLFIGEYSLQASFIGYARQVHKHVMVQPDVCAEVDFQLEAIPVVGNRIVIEGERTETRNETFTQSISARDIAGTGLKTVGEILQNVSGIDIIDAGPGSGQKRISIRGCRSNQVAILLDGVPLNDPLSGDVDLSLIPVSAIEKITVTKGGGSHVYGNGALGGVIDIVTKSRAVDGIGCGVTLGDFQARGIHPSLNGAWRRLSYSLQYERLIDEGTYDFEYARGDSETVRDVRRNADIASNNLFGFLSFHAGAHEATVKANLFRSARGLPGLVHALTPYARAETKWGTFLLDYRFLSMNRMWRLSLSRYSNDTKYRHLPPPDVPLEDRSQPPYHTVYDLLSHQGTLHMDWQISAQNRMKVQATARRDRLEDEDLLWPGTAHIGSADNMTYGFSLSSETEWPIFPDVRMKLSPTLRFDRIRFRGNDHLRTDKELNPHMGVSLTRVREYLITLKAGWGRSFRAPTFADLFYQDMRVRGNPEIQAEVSENRDIGLLTGLPCLGWLETEIDYFRRSVENLIVWRMGSFASFSPYNTDALISGWEFSAQWTSRNDQFQISLDHMILDPVNKSGERTTHNKRLPYQAEHTTKLGLTLHMKHVSVDYHKRLVGARYVTEANTVRMEPYSADDVSLICSIPWKKADMNMTISVFNILDRTYEMIERTPLAGRYWRGGVELRF